MKKMIKLSLVAAVAVAGLTTSATAGSLTDAIKDTTISGKAMIGYNYQKVGAANATNTTEYDLDITMTSKVNDTISFTTGVEADHDIATEGAVSTDAGKGNEIGLTKAYFTAKTSVATVMIGKQKQPTPFYDDERGDGVVAIVPAGPVTLAAGHFTGMNGTVAGVVPNADYDITAAAVIGSAGPVNGSLWYANIGSDLADAYSLNLNGTVGPVKVDLTHSSAELGAAGSEDETLTKLIVSGKVANVNLVAGYGVTNDTTTRVHGVDLTTDNDGKTNFRLDQLVLDSLDDASAILVGASMSFGKTTVGIDYLTVDLNAGSNATEVDLNVKYAMSKNFSVTGLYSDTNNVGGDDTRMELSLNYKF